MGLLRSSATLFRRSRECKEGPFDLDMLKGEEAQARGLIERLVVDQSRSNEPRAEVEDAGGVEVQEREIWEGRPFRTDREPKPLGSAGNARAKGADVSDRRPRRTVEDL
jgi:hypothetical protein